MKTLPRLLGCFVLTITLLTAAPAPDTFISSLRGALEARQLDSLRSLHDFTETPPAIQEDLLRGWAFIFKDLEKNWTIKSIEHLEKNAFIQQNQDAAEKVGRWTTPMTVGGKSYVISGEIIGVIVLTLSSPDGKGKQEKFLPVVKRSDGSVAIAAIKEVK